MNWKFIVILQKIFRICQIPRCLQIVREKTNDVDNAQLQMSCMNSW